MSGLTTVEDVLSAFPQPTLPKIQGRPDYESLVQLRKALRANAASIRSNLGGGAHGYAALTLTPAQYNTLTGQVFNAPVHPGVHPNIPAGATGAQISALERQHKADIQEYQEYLAVQQALKKQLIGAVDPIYLRALEDRVLGYANQTVLHMLTHLFENYAQLTATELFDNLTTKLTKPWDPSTPFEAVISQIEDCAEFAEDGNSPLAANQILHAAYSLVFNSGAYFDELKEWDRKPAAQRATWDQFKAFMQEAQQRRNRTQRVGGPNHFANQALLADLEATVREVLKENLPPLNQQPPLQQQPPIIQQPPAPKSDEAMSCMLASTTELMKQIAALQQQVNKLQQPNQRNSNNRGQQRQPRNNGNYCWTHGFRVGRNHNSMTCFSPAPGHQKEATKENRMGGSTLGMPTPKPSEPAVPKQE